MSTKKIVTGAVLLIADELLYGRTEDKNLSYIARFLEPQGIQIREARIVPDISREIIAAVNALRARYDYVFTTGGIGPTHDDITADSIAEAFGVGIDDHPDALAALEAHYAGEDINDARRRMARIPHGATLIANPVSAAPGFMIGNVCVMAGVPAVMHAMLDSLAPGLEGGEKMNTRAISAKAREGDLAEFLTDIQNTYPDVSIGCYPFFHDGHRCAHLVIRALERGPLNQAFDKIWAAVEQCNGHPKEVTSAPQPTN